MKNNKIYTSSDGRKFIVRKKANKLVAVSVEDKTVSYGTLNIDTEKCVGGTHCFEGLRNAFEELNKGKKSFRITYRMEVIIKASSKEEAKEIFENMSNKELANKSEYVELVSFDDWDD